jgi:hypothetical protein
MPSYEVRIPFKETGDMVTYVDADDEQDAINKGYEKIKRGCPHAKKDAIVEKAKTKEVPPWPEKKSK